MSTEALDELGHDRFVGYQEHGGRLSRTDYDLIKSLLSKEEGDRQLIEIPERYQASLIANHCGIELTPDEIYAYCIMRRIIPTEKEVQESKNVDTTSTWKMSDQELLRQVILAIEGPEDKYWIITNKYPNIFD